MFDLIMIILAIILGVVAAVQWWRHGQSIRKGFGYTFHWWALGDLGAGMLICLIAMVGIFIVEWLLGGIRVVSIPFNLASLDDNLFILIFGVVIEEVFFRSLLLSGLVVVLGGRKWPAILISAAVFGLVHINNPGASYVSAFGNALGGVIYGIAFLGGQNIWLPLGLHFSWNFSQGPILGFPVSGENFGGLIMQEVTGSDLLTGGAYGPEAGLVGMIFRFVIMAMVIAYLQWRCGGRGNTKTLEFPIKVYANPPRR
ncbi:MAG: CPBP family intramembrane metalloprotease [Anaerolineales bacterium]|nr:CPBP family intramembrane metalloprotease [Anaerolineales bacterium]